MVTKKTKVKEWHPIVAPEIFGKKEIGKTMVSDPNQLIGRKIILNVIEFGFDNYFMKISFKIKKIENGKALTDFSGIEYLRDYVSRMVLRRIRRIDVIRDLKTKDGIGLRVKALAIISRRVKSSIQVKIRNDIGEMIKKGVENSSLEQFIKETILENVEKKILVDIRKIYPVRKLVIRRIEVLQN